MKCESCENDATIHITEIRRGLSYDRHLCEKCAEMFLPLEGSDYARYLDFLPPRHSTTMGDEPAPTQQELEMTGLRQQVVVVELATGEVRPVGPDRGDSFSPVWSPDSRRLALCHSLETLDSLVIVEPGRDWTRRFVRTTFAEPASWSPDGRTVCFSHPEDGGRIIVAAEVEEGKIRRLSTKPYLDELLPVWSPADDRIAFVSRMLEGTPEQKAGCTVCTTTAETGERCSLLTLEARLVMRLGWSGDARFIAALAVSADSQRVDDLLAPPEGKLLVLSSQPGDEAPVEVPGNFAGFAWVPKAPAPGGGPLLLADSAAEDETSTVIFFHPQSRQLHTVGDQLIFPAGEMQPGHLSPDGTTLVSLRGLRAGRISLIDVVTGSAAEMEPQGEVASLTWHPGGREIAALIRSDKGVRLEMLSRTGGRREITTFRRDDFFDVPRMVLSPDGRLAAVEAHVARKG